MSFSFCRVFVLCCIMFPVLDTGVLLWRSGWGHWGCDCFTQPPRWPLIFNQWDVEMLNSDYFHSQYCLLFKTFTNTYLVNMLKSVPAMCIQKQALPPPKKTLSLCPYYNFHTRTFICSFTLNTCTHLRSSFPPSLAANLISAFFFSLSRLVTQIVTSEPDPSPGVPSCWPCACPQEQLNTEEQPSSYRTKGQTYHAHPSWVQPSAQGAH